MDCCERNPQDIAIRLSDPSRTSLNPEPETTTTIREYEGLVERFTTSIREYEPSGQTPEEATTSRPVMGGTTITPYVPSSGTSLGTTIAPFLPTDTSTGPGASTTLNLETSTTPSPACLGDDSCCSPDSQCGEGEGDCDTDNDCFGDLLCVPQGCDRTSFPSFDSTDDCCLPVRIITATGLPMTTSAASTTTTTTTVASTTSTTTTTTTMIPSTTTTTEA